MTRQKNYSAREVLGDSEHAQIEEEDRSEQGEAEKMNRFERGTGECITVRRPAFSSHVAKESMS